MAHDITQITTLTAAETALAEMQEYLAAHHMTRAERDALPPDQRPTAVQMHETSAVKRRAEILELAIRTMRALGIEPAMIRPGKTQRQTDYARSEAVSALASTAAIEACEDADILTSEERAVMIGRCTAAAADPSWWMDALRGSSSARLSETMGIPPRWKSTYSTWRAAHTTQEA